MSSQNCLFPNGFLFCRLVLKFGAPKRERRNERNGMEVKGCDRDGEIEREKECRPFLSRVISVALPLSVKERPKE